MGSKTIKGYPIPADKNPNNLPEELIFPWGPASTLVTWAERVNVPGVRENVDIIHGMLGNPNNVPPITSAWRTAVQELTSSIDGSDHSVGLQTAKENLTGRWNGPAREAAVSYVERIVKTTEDTRKILADITGKIDAFRSKIVNNYSTAIGHIANYATIILQYAGDTLAVVEGALTFDFDLAGQTKAIVKALKDFITETTAVIKDVITYRDNLLTGLEEIRTLAAQIAVPPEIAPVALDNGSWKPRKPTGPPVG
ncbi:WXG100 family type VII secretion target [Nocardia sp. NPDC052566]|uniref:WXG100 family type VII secretion target n=1 Tax=Nocardia sp. NPDC052566 TaxID=3364330 RepID=UPI0037CA9550